MKCKHLDEQGNCTKYDNCQKSMNVKEMTTRQIRNNIVSLQVQLQVLEAELKHRINNTTMQQ